MTEKIMLEFFPEMVYEIPECPDDCCCLKPVITQSNESTEMHILAQHIRWMYRKKVELIIPSKTDSRVTPVKKYVQFRSNLRQKRLGIKKLPALALAGNVICEGKLQEEDELENKVKKILNEIKK